MLFPVLSREKIIRIAGGVGAVLATLVLTFLVCKFTKCCSCCFKQKAEPSFAESPQEAAPLTADNTTDDGPLTTTIDDSVIYSNVNNTTEAPLAEDEFEETALAASDTESLHQFNEVPPSYESLYLTEDGIEISPPEYCPPKHKERLPPRRVHTFN